MDENKTFRRANMPIRVAAEALKKEPQTVRIMIQMGIVPWGKTCGMSESKRGFSNFEQHSYKFDDLEELILQSQKI